MGRGRVSPGRGRWREAGVVHVLGQMAMRLPKRWVTALLGPGRQYSVAG